MVVNDLGKREHFASYFKPGVTPMIYGATGKLKAWGLKLVDTENVIKFIIGYATEHRLPQPAASRASASTPLLLPSSRS